MSKVNLCVCVFYFPGVLMHRTLQSGKLVVRPLRYRRESFVLRGLGQGMEEDGVGEGFACWHYWKGWCLIGEGV